MLPMDERDGWIRRDGALVLDGRHRVAEATGVNLLLAVGDTVVTPTPDCFLEGIIRRTVMRLARERGLEVVERAVMPDELPQSDEMIPAGTAAEVVPVRRVDELHVRIRPAGTTLADAYAGYVRGTRLATAA